MADDEGSATPDETARLEQLRLTELLDSPPEAAFDRLTEFARRLLGVPVSLVSLPDGDRQFFKSARGLTEPWASARETPRSHSFCRHVVASGEPLVVEDAREHPLVRDNPAIRDLGVVAYLGTPIFTPGGHAVATLCAIDHGPRRWTADDVATLAQLAAIAMTEIALRLRVRERTEALARSNARFSQAFYLNPIPACMTTLGQNETFLEVNDAFLSFTGYSREEVVGRASRDLGLWSSPEDRRELGAAQRGGTGLRDLELGLRAKDGGSYTVLMSAEVIEFDGSRGLLKMFYDVTARKEGEALVHRAIQEVMDDASWFSHKVVERLAQLKTGNGAREAVEFSRREREVLELMAGGLNNDAIARELGVAVQTVRNYIAAVYDKLGVHTRGEAIVWARERGITGGRPER